MKFGQEILALQIAPWKAYYINYKNLKKLIKSRPVESKETKAAASEKIDERDSDGEQVDEKKRRLDVYENDPDRFNNREWLKKSEQCWKPIATFSSFLKLKSIRFKCFICHN